MEIEHNGPTRQIQVVLDKRPVLQKEIVPQRSFPTETDIRALTAGILSLGASLITVTGTAPIAFVFGMIYDHLN